MTEKQKIAVKVMRENYTKLGLSQPEIEFQINYFLNEKNLSTIAKENYNIKKEILGILKRDNQWKDAKVIADEIGRSRARIQALLEQLVLDEVVIWNENSDGNRVYSYNHFDTESIKERLGYKKISWDEDITECEYCESGVCETTAFDRNKLIEYIKIILDLYTDIIWYKKRFEILRSEKKQIYSDSFQHAYIFLENNKPKMPIFPNNKPMPIDDYVAEPQPPILKEPGLFNKKRIELENNQIMERYRIDCVNYEEYLRKKQKYQTDLKHYNEAVEKYHNEIERINNSRTDDVTIMVQDMMNNKNTAQIALIDYELEYILSNVRETVNAINNLYSSGPIYSKYRNCFALSYFCEYLMSGRCESLEGSNGAYNLFETEMKADMIISRLDNIINSLNKIQKNQSYMFHKIEGVKESINQVTGQLLVNNILNTVQINQLDEINYNTKVGAYYAEKTARITNALGFLVAMKK